MFQRTFSIFLSVSIFFFNYIEYILYIHTQIWEINPKKEKEEKRKRKKEEQMQFLHRCFCSREFVREINFRAA